MGTKIVQAKGYTKRTNKKQEDNFLHFILLSQTLLFMKKKNYSSICSGVYQ